MLALIVPLFFHRKQPDLGTSIVFIAITAQLLLLQEFRGELSFLIC